MGWYPCCCGGSTDCSMCQSGTQQPYVEADLPAISAGGFYTCPFNNLIADLPYLLGSPGLCTWQLKTTVTVTSALGNPTPVDITLWFRYARNVVNPNTAVAQFIAGLGHGTLSNYYEWLLEVSDPSGTYLFDCSVALNLPFRQAVGGSGLGTYCGDTTGLGDVIITPHA